MPIKNNIITLLTDFGETDGFVGTMKGVILGIHPAARIIDISHQIPPQDIDAGAFVLRNCYRYFPERTIHVVVIDPGVGSERRIILVETERYFFLAPDNSVLKYIFHEEKIKRVFNITNHNFFLKQISHTFHGRDIFAPVAAHLASGIAPGRFGEEITDYEKGEIDFPEIDGNKITGKIIHIDGFGNLITNISSSLLEKNRIFSISLGTQTIKNLSNSYAEVEIGKPVALIGSSGYLEIGIRNGNAQEFLQIQRNDQVIVWLN